MHNIATRQAYGEALAQLGKENPSVIVLDADLSCATYSNQFAKVCPDRFIQCGIAEANMVGVAAGLATTGLLPIVHSFAMFATGRVYDQIRNSVAYPQLNVKIVGTHAGLSVGEDGATHQCIEDIALMRAIPDMTVLCPCDAHECHLVVQAMLAHTGPLYLRIGRNPVPIVTDTLSDDSFQMGKGRVLTHGTDIAIIATGMMVQEACKAAQQLQAQNLSATVVDMHTIKPIDSELLQALAQTHKAIVTTEEHNILGGLGDAVSLALSGARIPIVRHGVQDQFGRSGKPQEVLDSYHLNAQGIVDACHRALAFASI